MNITTINVIKIGGNVIDSEDALTRFLGELSQLDRLNPIGSENLWILVHGGGKIATDLAKRLGVEAQMVDGRRVTDAAMLEIVTMVYGGLVNKRIVAGLQAKGINALGLTGADGNIIKARKRQHPTTDFGFVGDIDAVNAAQILALMEAGFVPIISPLTHDKLGTMLNTNADTIASAVASAIAGALPHEKTSAYTVRLVYCFEKQGVLRSIDDENSVIPTLSAIEIEYLQASGAIAKGMLPKLDNALSALKNGVDTVCICHSNEITSVLQGKQRGTMIVL
jgi:acetylglutamate kinase